MEFIDSLGYPALGSRLKRLSDMIMSDVKTIYEKGHFNFDPRCFPVFQLLNNKAPLGIMEIAAGLKISHPYVIQLTREMHKKGIITNVSNSKDARKRSISLTKKGRLLFKELEPLWDNINHAMEATLQEKGNELLACIRLLENSLEEKSFANRIMEIRNESLRIEVEIIPFSPELKNHFKNLNYEWLEKYFEVEPIDARILSDPLTHIIKPGGEIIFARYHNEIVGTCALKKVSKDSYELTKMAVTAKVQGMQIGKKLGQAMLELAAQKKARLVFLESNRKLTPALSLYQKLGFIEKLSPFKRSDYARSDIYMEKEMD